ncbi:MAG: amino acid permease [Muribaculaceae bacterium]|nr:amino acid permease [Muribaculaceae bacterium]
MADNSTTQSSTSGGGSSDHKLGLMGLTAIVFSSMIGGGIFNIAQNMAAGAGLGAVIISWLITAFGILFLVLTFKVLANRRPDYNAGIYQYAQAGFGDYVGFNIAWGYWLCVALGNVAYAVMLNDSFGAFFPVFLKHGWPTMVFGVVLIWGMFFLVVRGLQTASGVNNVMTIIKFAALVLIIILLIIYFKVGLFTKDFWGHMNIDGFKNLGGIGSQIESTMLVTMWCFIGIEGAVMMSSRAKKPKDVGKASVLGFYLALILYALVSILCFGIMTQPQMANLDDPSVAYVLRTVCGDWAYYFVVVTVILSLLSSWVAWTLVCAQTPYGAASVKILPKQFLKMNKHEMPAYGLVASSIFMTIFMILVCTAHNVYMAALNLTTVMVLPAYFFSGLYLWKAAASKKNLLGPNLTGKQRNGDLWIGIICTLYCAWCLYAGGLLLLLVTSIFYLPGTYFYYLARRQQSPDHKITGKQLFKTYEWWIFIGLIACTVVSIILLIMNKVNLSS